MIQGFEITDVIEFGGFKIERNDLLFIHSGAQQIFLIQIEQRGLPAASDACDDFYQLLVLKCDQLIEIFFPVYQNKTSMRFLSVHSL